ncbi:hypothetical protein E2C01_001827 [Portunus trituberculatus]|uniref:Uncharacterized protein n=1 Tax=Portunus trituberculatus TaxID=210409 RepID=A0A5B7CKH4_PORTR|nr:hypothetical protein [Portunus trituberculatus]
MKGNIHPLCKGSKYSKPIPDYLQESDIGSTQGGADTAPHSPAPSRPGNNMYWGKTQLAKARQFIITPNVSPSSLPHLELNLCLLAGDLCTECTPLPDSTEHVMKIQVWYKPAPAQRHPQHPSSTMDTPHTASKA